MRAFSTLVDGIAYWARVQPHQPATHGRAADGEWFHQTWSEHWQRVQRVGHALISLGHRPGQPVAIVGANCCEWVESQFGIQAAAGLPVPLYPTGTTAQLVQIINEVEADVLFCQDASLLARLLEAEQAGTLRKLRACILLRGTPEGGDARVMSYADFLERGQRSMGSELGSRIEGRAADDVSLLIYTSGTTGRPKGVMIDDAGQLQVLEGLKARFPTFASCPYRVVSYLPLSHQAEQLVTNVGTVLLGGQVYFCPEIGAVRDFLLHVRPTLFLAVPRVWEKFQAALQARLEGQQGVAKLLVQAATTVEGYAQAHPEQGSPLLKVARQLARKAVLDKIRHGLGLDQLEVAMAGSAPIDVATLQFFAKLGIPIYEGYGLTETTGVATFNVFGEPRPGTVGPPLPGVDLKLGQDGEVLLRSAMNSRGYYKQPEASAELFTEEGFLRTGDLGELDAGGSLRIVGRKKELLITAGGKNVAPLEVETLINRLPGVGQSVLVGDRQPYLCMLLTLDPENLESLAAVAGGGSRSLAELATEPQVQAHLARMVRETSEREFARYQQPKKVCVLASEFSVDGGELTPSLKLRRQAISEKYAEEIAAMYAAPGTGQAAVASRA